MRERFFPRLVPGVGIFPRFTLVISFSRASLLPNFPFGFLIGAYLTNTYFSPDRSGGILRPLFITSN